MNPLSTESITPLLHQKIEELEQAFERGNLSKKALAQLVDLPYHTVVGLFKRDDGDQLTVQEKHLTFRGVLNLLIATRAINQAIEEGELPRKTAKASVEWAESITPPRE